MRILLTNKQASKQTNKQIKHTSTESERDRKRENTQDPTLMAPKSLNSPSLNQSAAFQCHKLHLFP
jgi:uncharacterized ferritin-like protein (DUF455 family)